MLFSFSLSLMLLLSLSLSLSLRLGLSSFFLFGFFWCIFLGGLLRGLLGSFSLGSISFGLYGLGGISLGFLGLDISGWSCILRGVISFFRGLSSFLRGLSSILRGITFLLFFLLLECSGGFVGNVSSGITDSLSCSDDSISNLFEEVSVLCSSI